MKTKDFSWAINYILKLIGQATPKRPPKGLDPTMYLTGTYEGDLELLDTTNQAIDLISTNHKETEKLEKALEKAIEMIYERMGECPSSYTDMTDYFWEHPEGCENYCNSVDTPIECWKLYLIDKGAK